MMEKRMLTMYRLMLLDDEKVVIRGIQRVFDLESMGFDLVGTFNNPLEAIDALEELQPDLIITDIKMPQMNGLEFSVRAKEILGDVEIVIFSGYGDFQFAQTAVKIGISDYLLKPIKKADFTAMMQSMYARIQEKKEKSSYFQSLQNYMDTNRAEWKNRLFLRAAEEGILEDGDLTELKRILEFDPETAPFLLVRFDLLKLPSREDYTSEVGMIAQSFQEEMERYGICEEFDNDESMYFILIGPEPDSFGEIRETVAGFCGQQREKGCRILYGISEIHCGIREMFQAATECQNQIFTIELRQSEAKDIQQAFEKTQNMPYVELDHLFRAIGVSDREGIRRSLDSLYNFEEDAQNKLTLDYVTSISYLIVIRMYLINKRYADSGFVIPGEILSARNIRRQYPSMEAQRAQMQKLAEELADVIASQQSGSASRSVQMATDYIAGHFHENITLQSVAEETSISKNYLSNLFKKEIGTTFLRYVTNLRLNRAKEYLLDTDMKLNDIAKAVGFHDYAYFSQIFKKNTGMTLSAYRKGGGQKEPADR
ncbi:MAG TPA: hypothetical protein DCF42_03935 [Lachnospiraceae bacterium]|nr:hypothetical protein [Lachnospiraceae bacterium]